MMNPPRLKDSAWLLMCGVLMLSGCATTTGAYTVTAVDAQGKPINAVFHVQGRHIYSARNGICAAQPKAVVTIRSKETGKELEGESPIEATNEAFGGII